MYTFSILLLLFLSFLAYQLYRTYKSFKVLSHSLRIYNYFTASYPSLSSSQDLQVAICSIWEVYNSLYKSFNKKQLSTDDLTRLTDLGQVVIKLSNQVDQPTINLKPFEIKIVDHLKQYFVSNTLS